jgi:regulation of enolase protein 1 (concanavalin A-like superfamily)
MKKQFALALLGFIILHTQAQEASIKAIPYAMHFENTALDYKMISDNHIRFSSPANSDLFIAPDGLFEINKSPRLIFKPDSDFILTAKIQLEFKSKWDAGVLLVYNDAKHFAKFCFESDFKGQPRVVSVVCNLVADDCNSMAIDKNEVFYRITGSSKGNTFGFYYSTDGKSWFPVRTFKLDKTDNLHIGFSAQSPVGKSCLVDFSNIDLQQRKLVDSWQGN